jgi:ribose/xylose/arabinose/galactoside ABC-type transport system permease subunit
MSDAITKKFRGTALRKYISVIVLLALVLFNCIFTKNFVSWMTFSNLFMQASKVALVALGMTLVIATGGIDISVGSAMGLGATISAVYLVDKQPFGIFVSLIVVLVFGALAGTLVSKFKILPMIVTLAFFYIERGLAQVISGIGTVTYSYPALQKFFITPIAGHIPVHFFILLIAVVIMYIVVNRMRFGSQIEAYGNNSLAARICGINTMRIVIIAYAVSALFAWMSGMLEMTVVTCADPSRTGQDMEINAIASVVVGGTNINGGYPNIIGSVCGAFILQLITMMCNMNNITYSIALMIKAGIIVIALFFHGFRRK